MDLAYEVTLRAARPIMRAVAKRDGKLGRGLAGRESALERIERWAAKSRAPDRPLLWLHAPSVGEAHMAAATLRALRESDATRQFVLTYFSPSAERIASGIDADFVGYLPWDVRGDVRRALDTLSPQAIIFVRTEIWPALVREAARRGVRLALVNAVLRADSGRLRPLARTLLGPAYRALDAVGAVSDVDGARYIRLGVPEERISVTGDARFDQVLARVDAIDRDDPLLAELRALPPVLVAGSTWPADEAVLIPAFRAARKHVPLRLVVAPHEPSAQHLEGLEHAIRNAGLESIRLSQWHAQRIGTDREALGIGTAREAYGSGTDLEAYRSGTEAMDASSAASAVLIVDRIGVLADLYDVGFAAYVGGGFGRHGLHSVIEPAALGKPVGFGPRVGSSAEADRLEQAGGATRVHDARTLADWIVALAQDEARAGAAGTAARAFARSNSGGAARNAALVDRMLQASLAPAPEGTRASGGSPTNQR